MKCRADFSEDGWANNAAPSEASDGKAGKHQKT